jgi:hypothetical protein
MLAADGFGVIVKLHDRSYDLAQRASGGIDWRERMERYRDHPLVRVVHEPDATPYLAAADALVTDHSSIGFEFSLLDRPIVVVDCPALIAGARIARSKVTALRSAAEVVNSIADVAGAVTRQLEDPSLHSRERRALAETFFYRPGTATDRAVAEIYAVLQLEGLPVAAPLQVGSVPLAAGGSQG